MPAIINKKIIVHILIWQILFVSVVSLILGWAFTLKISISFALGGLTSIMPGWLFAKIFFKYTNATAAKKIVHSFFYGEAIKWFITIVLFVLVFQWKGLQAIPFFLGFILTQLLYWFALIKLE